MAKATRAWYSVIQRLFAFLSILTGMTVIVACSYTIYMILPTDDLKIENGTLNETVKGTDKSTAAPEVIKSDGLSEGYKNVVVSCSAVSLVGALPQVISSILVLFMCSGKFGRRSKWWLAIQILSVIVMISAVLITLSFNKTNGETLNLEGLGNSLKSSMKALHKFESLTDLEKETHAFLMALILNGALLLILLAFNFSLMCCGLYKNDADEDYVDNFGDSKNSTTLMKNGDEERFRRCPTLTVLDEVDEEDEDAGSRFAKSRSWTLVYAA